MHFLRWFYHLYADGFRTMTWGRTLWAVVLVKLLVIFLVLRVFFFPDWIGTHSDGDPAQFVEEEISARLGEMDAGR